MNNNKPIPTARMKSTRVSRGKQSQQQQKFNDDSFTSRPSSNLSQQGRVPKTIYSSANSRNNNTPELIPTTSEQKGSGILNRNGPITAASDIITMMTSENELEPPPPLPKPKLQPFNLAYIPPTIMPSYRDVCQNRARPLTAISSQIQQIKEDDSNTSSTMANYQKFLQHGTNVPLTIAPTAGPPAVQQKDMKDDNSSPKSPRPKMKQNENKNSSIEVVEHSSIDIEEELNLPVRIQISKSECNVSPPRPIRTFQPQVNDIRKLPEWLVMAAEKDKDLEKLANPSGSLSMLPSILALLAERRVEKIESENKSKMISSTGVKHTTPIPSRVSMTSSSRNKPNMIIPLGIPLHKPSSTSLSSGSFSSMDKNKPIQIQTPPTSAKLSKPESGGGIPSLAGGGGGKRSTISSRSKAKPSVRKIIIKKIDAKVFDGPEVSRAIRSAVSAIKDIPTPQRMKRIIVTPDLKSPTTNGSIDSLKDKDVVVVGGKTKTKKLIKTKAKKNVTKKTVVKLNTPTDEFLGSQHHLADQQLQNLCERQKALEREVLILFENLQNVFCTDDKYSNNKSEIKCCCNSDTQEKMKILILKQKEVIQLQVDLRKRYGHRHFGSVVHVGPNEPILNGFNAHFGQLASHAREIEGRMVYYCTVCNTACDNELTFRRHLESTNHVLKTCKGIQNTQPIYTCDDCEQQIQGTTKYMSHVINSNIHNTTTTNPKSTTTNSTTKTTTTTTTHRPIN